jgi:hypothetical protein
MGSDADSIDQDLSDIFVYDKQASGSIPSAAPDVPRAQSYQKNYKSGTSSRVDDKGVSLGMLMQVEMSTKTSRV